MKIQQQKQQYDVIWEKKMWNKEKYVENKICVFNMYMELVFF